MTRDDEINRLRGQRNSLLNACESALERLEASQPPVGGATDKVCKQVRAAIARTKGQP